MIQRCPPTLSVVMPVHDPQLRDLERAVASVDRQAWPFWELCVADDASTRSEIRHFLDDLAKREDVKLVRHDESAGIAGATNAALALASGDFVVFLDHDDELADDAFSEVGRALARDPELDFLYSDHDVVDDAGARLQVLFKPDYSTELLLAYMYMGHMKVARRSLCEALGGFREGYEGAADHDFALRLCERSERIHHIPRVLYHWRAAPESMAHRSDTKGYAFESGRRAVDEALERRGFGARAEWPRWAQRARLGIFRPVFDETHREPVTILIPTRDRLDLLADCIASIEARTEYDDYRICILDNESREPETLRYFERTRHRVLSVPGPFNFSKIVNRGVEAAETEYVVLLNNDTLVVARGWLDELLGYARIEGVGAVGAKLLYPDGRIQHAGVTLGIHGLTAHAFDGKPDTHSPLEAGYYAHVARNCSAVTAACLMTRRSLYLELGGFDEEAFGVAWNDTDFCLRMLQSGKRVVMNPIAELIHVTSASRGDHKADTEVREMFARHAAWIENDPFYSPHLTRLDTDFAPRTRLDEASSFHYTKEGFREPVDAGGGHPAPLPSSLDLQEICLAQDRELRDLRQRVAALEHAARALGWITSRPLYARLRGSPAARRLWHGTRTRLDRPGPRRWLRRLGISR